MGAATKTYEHEYNGDGCCRRCSHDSLSSYSRCKVPPGQTIFDDPDNPRDHGTRRPMGTTFKKKGLNRAKVVSV